MIASDTCYACLDQAPPGRRIVLVRNGGGGCVQTGLDHPADPPEVAKRNVEWLNRRLGVSPREADELIAAALGRQEMND